MNEDQPPSLTPPPAGYADWLGDIKTQIHEAQQRAAQALNLHLVSLYWQIGRAILEQQEKQGWGAKIIDRLAQDLRTNFPEMKGFSRTNLMYMRAFAEAWPDTGICAAAGAQMDGGLYPTGAGHLDTIAIVHQLVDKLPWRHHCVLLDKLKTREDREWYLQKAIELKAGKFKPEHLGQLSFYLTAVDAQMKHPQDSPTIGLLLCKSKNKVVAEYALRDKAQPLGVAEYQLVESLPPELQNSLPSIEQIERELAGDPSEPSEESP